MTHHDVRISHQGCQPPARWFAPASVVTTFACSRRHRLPGLRTPSSLRFPLPHPPRGQPAPSRVPPFARWLLTFCLLFLPGTASGQLVGGPVVPSGYLRLDIDSHFITWNQRFGLRHEAGALIEEVEPLGWNLSSDALGSDRLPAAAITEARLRTLLGSPDYRFNLGSTTHLLAAHVRRVPLGFRMGVFRWLTVGASIPMVQRKLDSELVYLPGEANAGLAPSRSASGLFLDEYQTALSAARATVDESCASGDTTACLEGQAVVRKGDILFGSLSTLFGESVYFPLADAEVGQELVALLEEVRSGLMGIGGAGFTAPLPLGTPLRPATFDSLVVAPVFGVDGLPLRGFDALWEPGDLEVTAAIQLLNTARRRAEARTPEPPADSPEPPADSLDTPEEDSGSGLGVRLGVAGTLRLGTGTPQDTIRDFLDMDVAEGQTDIEVHAFGSLDWARRIGLVFDVRYGIASPVTVRRRITRPDAGFVQLPPLEAVRWHPGNYLDYAISPQLLLTPELTAGFVYRSYSRHADTFEGGEADLAPLALETEARVQSMGVDVTYSSFLGGGFPAEVRFGWEVARNGTGGRAPKTGRIRFGASLFRRIWGEG